MAHVLFFEKPGCLNNTRQKVLLAAAGHTVQAKSLLTEKWSSDRLRAFFGQLPVAQWFNLSAPRIRDGKLDYKRLTEGEALKLMLADPLLIRATDRRGAGAPLGMRPHVGMPRAGSSVAGIASGVTSRLQREPCSALRRAPLMEVDGECRVGFDPDAVERWIGLKSADAGLDLERCPKGDKSGHAAEPCPVESEA